MCVTREKMRKICTEKKREQKKKTLKIQSPSSAAPATDVSHSPNATTYVVFERAANVSLVLGNGNHWKVVANECQFSAGMGRNASQPDTAPTTRELRQLLPEKPLRHNTPYEVCHFIKTQFRMEA